MIIALPHVLTIITQKMKKREEAFSQYPSVGEHCTNFTNLKFREEMKYT